MQDHIIKQEDGIRFRKGIIRKPKGELFLNPKELYFQSKGKEYFRIPLSQITNVRAKKGFGSGVELMTVSYKASTKPEKVELEYTSLAGWAMGQAARLQPLYFATWEKAIDDARKGE